jgi:hypothetical protein
MKLFKKNLFQNLSHSSQYSVIQTNARRSWRSNQF